MKQPRQIAFDVLLRIERGGSYSNLALDAALKEQQLPQRDAAFAAALVYGVLERRMALDHALGRCLRQPIGKLKPEVLTALRLGAYQLLFLDRIPDSAAVNESVRLVKQNRSAYAAGLVNAVLHQVAKLGLSLLADVHTDWEATCLRCSIPPWLAALWREAYGEENARGIMEASVGRPPMIVRVNSLCTTPDELIRVLEGEGVEAVPFPGVEDALELRHPGAVERLPSFEQGLFHVQDAASQLCACALDAKPGETVFDLCAAPGGKSFTIAQRMENRGTVRAFDLYPQRVRLIEQGAQRLGLTCVQASVSDASVYQAALGTADRVLCDVPCSGLGILRRKPEIRYKSKEELDKLPVLQYRILGIAAQYVKQGGRLVYATCALNPAENDAVAERFLAEHPGFCLTRALPDPAAAPAHITLMPHLHGTDGFFIAAFERTV